MILHCFTERMHTNMIEKLVADSTGIEFVDFETEETLIDYNNNTNFKHTCSQ